MCISEFIAEVLSLTAAENSLSSDPLTSGQPQWETLSCYITKIPKVYAALNGLTQSVCFLLLNDGALCSIMTAQNQHQKIKTLHSETGAVLGNAV